MQVMKDVSIVAERGRVWTFDELPERSIALDGAVRGPRYEAATRRYSFDHHEGCVRHATRATCEQVREALLLGFEPALSTVYVNDVDADTALSVFMLLGYSAEKRAELADPALELMVRAVGRVDALGPAAVLTGPERMAARTVFSLIGASAGARESGSEEGIYVELGEAVGCVGVALEAIRRELPYELEAIRRELSYIEGLPPGHSPDRQVLRGWQSTNKPPVILALGGGLSRPFAMIEGGLPDFAAAYAAGHTRVIAREPAAADSWRYTVGKLSEFVAWDVPTILRSLAQCEPGWGGGSTIGGSPRREDGSSSRLTWSVVLEHAATHG